METLAVCILIYVAKTAEITLRTIRTVFSTKGERKAAAVVGFFEAIVYILIMGSILTDIVHAPAKIIAFALGFSSGILMGSIFEKKLGLGNRSIRAIVPSNLASAIMTKLHDAGYGVTCVDASGANSEQKMLYVMVRRKQAPDVINIIKETDNSAFITTSEVKPVNGGFWSE